MPQMRKAGRVTGKTLEFVNASVSDAEFILSLRVDEKKSQFLSKVAPDLGAQQRWLEQYGASTDQAYFVIRFSGEPVGTVRLYDPRDESFCWGSWILADSRPSHAAMESALMVYSYATEHLGYSGAHFDVRKGNERVWRFHERFGATRIGETEANYLYRLDRAAIRAALQRYAKFLPDGVKVEFDFNRSDG